MKISNKVLVPVILLLIGLFVYQHYDYPVAVHVTRGIDQTHDGQESEMTTLVARRDVGAFVDQQIRSINPAKIEVCPLFRDADLGSQTIYLMSSRDNCLTDYNRAGYRDLVEAAEAAEAAEISE